jgi:hypothetical protein
MVDRRRANLTGPVIDLRGAPVRAQPACARAFQKHALQTRFPAP